MRPKRTPESFQDQRCDQRNPEKVSRRGPGSPKAPQRPNKQFLSVRKPSLGALWRPPWGSSGGAQIVLFDMNRLHWPPKWSTEKQKFFLRILMKTCKNHCFFQCKTAFDARAEIPPARAINAPCGHQMLLFDMNQLHWPPKWRTEKQQIVLRFLMKTCKKQRNITQIRQEPTGNKENHKKIRKNNQTSKKVEKKKSSLKK